jgi:predicted DNA-binding transcriptional regulator AlpA
MNTINFDPSGDVYLAAKQLRARYDVSDMTIWRWLDDEKLSFPRPIYINRRRYWKLRDIEAWERSRARTMEAA